MGVDDGAGSEASFNSPTELLTLPDGSLLVADTAGDRIRRVCRLPGSESAPLPAGACVETVSSKGWLRPMGMALLPDGSVLICDHGHNRVRRLSADLRSVSAFAGCGLRGSKDGAAHAAQLDGPRGVCVWHNMVLVTDAHAVRAIVRLPGGGLHVATVAGGAGQGYADGQGAGARFRRPGALLPYAGSVLLCDTGNHCVRHLLIERTAHSAPVWTADERTTAGAALDAPPPAGAIGASVPAVTALTLCGGPVAGSADGALHLARFASPSGLVALPDAELLVSDSEGSRVRKVSLRLEAVSTLAGCAERRWGARDGLAHAALLNLPKGLALGAGGCVYVADSANNCVRAIVLPRASAAPRAVAATTSSAAAAAARAPKRSPSPKRAVQPAPPQPVTAETLGLPVRAAAAAPSGAGAAAAPRLPAHRQPQPTSAAAARGAGGAGGAPQRPASAGPASPAGARPATRAPLDSSPHSAALSAALVARRSAAALLAAATAAEAAAADAAEAEAEAPRGAPSPRRGPAGGAVHPALGGRAGRLGSAQQQPYRPGSAPALFVSPLRSGRGASPRLAAAGGGAAHESARAAYASADPFDALRHLRRGLSARSAGLVSPFPERTRSPQRACASPGGTRAKRAGGASAGRSRSPPEPPLRSQPYAHAVSRAQLGARAGSAGRAGSRGGGSRPASARRLALGETPLPQSARGRPAAQPPYRTRPLSAAKARPAAAPKAGVGRAARTRADDRAPSPGRGTRGGAALGEGARMGARLAMAEQLLLSVSDGGLSGRHELARLCGALESRVHRLEAQLQAVGAPDPDGAAGERGARSPRGPESVSVPQVQREAPELPSVWSHDAYDYEQGRRRGR